MRHNPQPQEVYRYFKGNLYQIRCLAKDSITGEMMVVYQAMYGDFQIYVSALSSFMEEIDRQKYPNADGYYRFELLSAQEVKQPAAQMPDTVREREGQETLKPAKEEKEAADMDAGIQEELNIDPLVLQFLDADSYERRLEILSMLHCRIDNDMINTMAVAVDVEIKEGEIEDRYEELKNCLLTFEKFECNRLR
ncbi:MAG: DUF1653 domain-containing protein [Blautia sp.]|nr:DUF1653 domain-containing protein [Blautia sp.]MCM1202193.1 DUF1653 domain-containing protein [Bacteroides fragilis]